MNISKKILLRISTTLLLMVNFHCVIKQVGSATPANPLKFANKIFEQVVTTDKNKNVLVSPAGIRSGLTVLFFGAEGLTEKEMRNVLEMGDSSTENIAKVFNTSVKSTFQRSENDSVIQLPMSNRFFVNVGLEIKPVIDETVSSILKPEVRSVIFTELENTIEKINLFVGNSTQHKAFKGFLQKNSISKETNILMVNAIYMKGKWEIPFNEYWTHTADFNDGKTTTPVFTMRTKSFVKYGEFPDLDAKVVELRYANSTLSMLIFLPNTVKGLDDLERKLVGKDLNEILSKMELREVLVLLPKFSIQYDLDYKTPLQKLGLKTVFKNNADFGGLFKHSMAHVVSAIKSRAYIDVNEAGSDDLEVLCKWMPPRKRKGPLLQFQADHPFAFFIRDQNEVYFAGHVVEI